MQIDGPMFDFAPAFLLFIFVSWAVTFVVALVFVVIAARLGTRAVLDELAKDRERRAKV